MTLDDFERELAEQKETERRREKRREHEKSSDRHHKHHHHHSHRSSRHHDSHYDEGHRSKRSRHSREDDTSESRHRHKHRRHSKGEEDREEEEPTQPESSGLKRDSWMEAPSALDVDYVQSKKPEPSPPKGTSLGANFELKIHEKELNHHLRDLQDGKLVDELEDQPAAHEVDYVFGDAGSQWRMTKLKAVYRQAEQSGRRVEDVALERFDSLREFDDAREEEIELDRRKTYGKGYVGKEKPSGELFQERKLDAGIRRPHPRDDQGEPDEVVEQIAVPASEGAASGPKVDQTTLNKLKAQLMRAQLRKDPKAADLEREYNEAVAAFSAQDPTIVTLSAMDNRMLSSAPRNEVKAVTNRRGAERGNVEENEDMSIEDMVREERRTKGQAGGEGQRMADRIAKDVKFDNDLDYMDENANKLAKRVHKSETNLRNIAINDYQKMQRVLENCPLCFHEDTDTPPVAPVVSLGTRTFLTLPTEPELSPQSAVIVPMQHHTNLLECDDDEWEEIRNFMKSLTRLYHEQGRDVIFYENAAYPSRKPHAALTVVPLPYELGETAPAFFKEAFLTTEDEWSQHKKIIDTLAKSKQAGFGRLAFRRSLTKEMPYFHVWFELDGGIGHVVEDPDRWPRGDLFAREIIGGMLSLEPDVIKRQGKWHRGHDKRVETFKKGWRKFDWTRILTEGN
ncbi:Pre-mRNA-splicing factor cwf19 [Knufia peltigerae]|uniref:Pre-mRNA-splicing factor cwf19 n=1 Tax=Knufia peltigerae TaxID=1002370 RepID=A0AA39D3L9_9EURO|nr:Pre-mRNA-splicing factor cwf19 [Knufia peltigerae]